MNVLQFEKIVAESKLPLVVDLWAPWCGPCKAMDPILAQAKTNFNGKVEVLKINSDDSQELLQKLGVVGIPTLLAYVNGKQVYRKTGMQSSAALNAMFEQLAEGKIEVQVSGLGSLQRILRLAIGTILVIFGFNASPAWVFFLLGGIVTFSAFYDRCPIYKAVTAKLKTLF